MHSVEDVFTSGVMDTIALSGDKIKYFDPADDDENVVNSKTRDGAAMFKQRASAVRKKTKVSVTSKGPSTKPTGANEDRDSITSRTRSKSKL